HALAVLVTGGSRGLGRAIAEHLARDGATVGIPARTPLEVEETAASIRDSGGRAKGFSCDVLDAGRVRATIESFRAWAQRFDALVCAAGQLKAVGPLET